MSAAHPARTVREQLGDLQMLPDPLQSLGQLVDRVERAFAWTAAIDARLADNECQHGRLAGDPTPPCGCFPNE